MKAVVAHHGSEQPIVLEQAPHPVGTGEVRIAVAAAAFTYFDAFVAAHSEALALPAEVGLGFDFSGIVTEVGRGVLDLSVGDRVAGLHTTIAAPVRAHSEELVMNARHLARVPDGYDLAIAAALPLSALTGRQALDRLGPERGELLVTGAAGSVGAWVLELARRDGWDVTALVRPGTEPLADAKRVITSLAGSYDAVLDAAALHGAAIATVRDGGRYVGFKPGEPQAPERAITVSTVEVAADGTALHDLLQLAADGGVAVRIAGQAALTQAPEVYRRGWSESGSKGRWLLVP